MTAVPPVPLGLSFNPSFSWCRPFGAGLVARLGGALNPLKIPPCAGGSFESMGAMETALRVAKWTPNNCVMMLAHEARACARASYASIISTTGGG